MPVFAHLHQLFNAEQCQASLHTLRWKDRPLQCPRCQSHTMGRWGTYQYRPGCKRYWCHNCKRTFNDLTKPLLPQSQRPLAYWILATFLWCLACSSRRMAREVGVHIRTSYRWCWWLRNAALSYEMHRQLEGTVEADALSHTAGNQGQAAQGGKKALGRRARGRRKKREPGRGHDDKDRPAIIAWVSRQGSVVIQAPRDFTVKTVAEGRCPRRSNGPSAVHGLGQQLSGVEGLWACLCQAHEKGVCPRGGPGESGRVSVFLTQAVPTGVARCQ
jgi:transposase-like protein